MADKGSRNSVHVPTVILVVISVIFAATAVVQFIWTNQLQKKYEQSQRDLVQLKTDCFQYSLRGDLGSVLALNNKEPEALKDGSGRQRRDLTQMLTEMMVAQEKVLLSHCLNDTVKLCIPGPKGDPGFKGDPGIPGTLGTQGVQGAVGAKGDPGVIGQKGDKGDIGTKGDPGVQGGDGQKGELGPKGAPGSKGQKGELGAVGPKGEPGLKGEKGDTGLQGAKGNQGPVGLRGEKGDQGLRGQKGEIGAVGPQGPPGSALQNDCLCLKPPKIDVFEPQNQTLYYRLGSKLQLTCDSNSSSPAPTVSWTLPTPNPCVTPPGQTIDIDSLQPSEVGNYTCTVTNQYGSASKTFVINSEAPSAISCDFEKNNLCLWQTNQSSVGTWQVNKGPTQTSNTGPDADHTKGTSTYDGVYAYIESSFDGAGANAYLASPELPSSGQACFTFWYNMHGASTGALNLETVERLSDCSEKIQVRLPLNGDQGRVWHQAQINLPAINNPHRIVLKSTRVAGVYGDIAVDDLEYYSGKCKSNMKLDGPKEVFITVPSKRALTLVCNVTGSPQPTITWSKMNSCGGTYQTATGPVLQETQHATSGDSGTYICTASNGPSSNITKVFHVKVNDTGFDEKCSFDNGDFCGWQQLTSDTFNWTLHSGPTQSDGTGPDTDHTNTKSGNHMYVYIETSSPRVKGDFAELVSHMLPANQTKCLDLWYYMYGSETGNVKIYLEDQCTHQRKEVFTQSGDKGQQWNHGSVNIPASSVPNDYKIVIRGDVGTSYHGDTGLDDIHISDSTCSVSSIDCDFDQDTCQWTQSTSDVFDWTRLSGSTASSNTGPSGDHGPNGQGSYMYIEGSQPRTPGETATLKSPQLPAGQDYCLSLATNMYGDTMGSIEVVVEDVNANGNGQTTLQTYSTADTVEQWRQHSVYIPAQSNGFRILIKGIIGSGFASDAAIDDLNVHTGTC